MNNRSDILIAFALGAVAGILLAPDRGEVTRRKITEKSKDLFGNARDRVGDVAETLRDQGRAMKEAVTSAKDSYREEVGRPRPGLRSETNP